MFKGETVVQPFAHVIEGTTTPVDITGWTLEFTLKKRTDDTAAVFSKACVITTPLQGQYEVHIDHADTVGLDSGIYLYDIQRIDGGSETPVSIGMFTIKQELLYP
jgi:hypothetical protein